MSGLRDVEVNLEARVRAAGHRHSAEGISPVGTNLGFEDGTLKGWTATGEAWKDMPVKGDTVTPRRPGQASGHAGKYWVGSYERGLSDAPQGTLTSEPFEVTHPWASFLVGGGPGKQTRVELVEAGSGEVAFAASGREVEDMARVIVDLSAHRGNEIRVRVVDESGGFWGQAPATRPSTPPATSSSPPTRASSASISSTARTARSK